MLAPPGWRTDFLTQMGFGVPDASTTRRTTGSVPRDQMAPVLDAADVLIWTTESDDEQAALLADPTIAALKRPRPMRATSSPVRTSPAPSPSRRRCPTPWSPTNYHPLSPRCST